MEIVTSTEIYWVMQADGLRDLCEALAVFGGCYSLIATVVVIGAFNQAETKLPKIAACFAWFVCVGTFTIGFLGVGFIPSTKTMATMHVVPAIVNNETLQEESSELYNIAKEALKEKLGAEDKKEGKQ